MDVCDVCGGPMVWTIVRGDRWMACESDSCDQLELFGLPTLYAKGDEFAPEHWMELSKERGVVPCEGGDARMSAVLEQVRGGPPPGFLESLWEGADA